MEQHSYRPAYAPTRGPSWRQIASLALVLALVLSCAVLALTIRDALDPSAQAARDAARYREMQIAEHLTGLDVLIAALWRLLPLALIGGGAFVGLGIAWRRWGWRESIGAHYTVQALQADRQCYPASLQHLSVSYHNAARLTGSSPLDEREALPGPPLDDVPTFRALLDRGKVGQGNPLLLGFDVETGAELSGSWLDLYSTAVSGMPGSGKTTSQRFLACQTALHGARFAICDPHAGAADDSLAATLAPLQAAFVCAPAESDRAILEVVRYVADVGRRRVAGQDRDTTPLILWVDELTALLGRSSVAGPLAELLEQVAQEYRKRFVFVCASGQIWTAARTTSELRDSFASVLCHRMKRAQARLLLPTDEAEQVERLTTGRAVLWRTSGATQVVQIPNTTAQDCQRVAGMLPATRRLPQMPKSSQNEAPDMPDRMPEGSQREAYTDQATSASGRGNVASAEAKRAASLFLGGMDPAAIVLELRGVKSSEGKRYQTALGEVLGLIREGVSG